MVMDLLEGKSAEWQGTKDAILANAYYSFNST